MSIVSIPAIKGIYHDGKIELLENIPYKEDKKVLIVFLDDIGEKDVPWEEAVSNDFLKGYSKKDSAYDKL